MLTFWIFLELLPSLACWQVEKDARHNKFLTINQLKTLELFFVLKLLKNILKIGIFFSWLARKIIVTNSTVLTTDVVAASCVFCSCAVIHFLQCALTRVSTHQMSYQSWNEHIQVVVLLVKGHYCHGTNTLQQWLFLRSALLECYWLCTHALPIALPIAPHRHWERRCCSTAFNQQVNKLSA